MNNKDEVERYQRWEATARADMEQAYQHINVATWENEFKEARMWIKSLTTSIEHIEHCRSQLVKLRMVT